MSEFYSNPLGLAYQVLPQEWLWRDQYNKMWYHTSCVVSTAEKIDAMIEAEQQITYRTFRKYVVDLDTWAAGMGYADHSSRSGALRLCDDWHVSYWKSMYDGKPCVFLDHSRIEHIWVPTPIDDVIARMEARCIEVTRIPRSI